MLLSRLSILYDTSPHGRTRSNYTKHFRYHTLLQNLVFIYKTADYQGRKYAHHNNNNIKKNL